MSQRNEGIVVGRDPGSPAVEVGKHVMNRPEEDQGLVNEMAPEIEQQTARFIRRTALPPTGVSR